MVGLTIDAWTIKSVKATTRVLEEMVAGRTEIHDVIAANGAVVYLYVPGPKGNCVPLLQSQILCAE